MLLIQDLLLILPLGNDACLVGSKDWRRFIVHSNVKDQRLGDLLFPRIQISRITPENCAIGLSVARAVGYSRNRAAADAAFHRLEAIG